jgi:hypothetical protein
LDPDGQIRGLKRDERGQWEFQELLDTTLLITSGNQDAAGTIFVTGRTQGDAASVDEGTKSDRAKHQDSLWRIVRADQVPPGTETVPIEELGPAGRPPDPSAY